MPLPGVLVVWKISPTLIVDVSGGSIPLPLAANAECMCPPGVPGRNISLPTLTPDTGVPGPALAPEAELWPPGVVQGLTSSREAS